MPKFSKGFEPVNQLRNIKSTAIVFYVTRVPVNLSMDITIVL